MGNWIPVIKILSESSLLNSDSMLLELTLLFVHVTVSSTMSHDEEDGDVISEEELPLPVHTRRRSSVKNLPSLSSEPKNDDVVPANKFFHTHSVMKATSLWEQIDEQIDDDVNDEESAPTLKPTPAGSSFDSSQNETPLPTKKFSRRHTVAAASRIESDGTESFSSDGSSAHPLPQVVNQGHFSKFVPLMEEWSLFVAESWPSVPMTQDGLPDFEPRSLTQYFLHRTFLCTSVGVSLLAVFASDIVTACFDRATDSHLALLLR